ncbi:hypothetical protein GB937_008753 [Aspergillus fischeri]|nr:hypothetical protein GB937_008753 [Aspergillus fischeri]
MEEQPPRYSVLEAAGWPSGGADNPLRLVPVSREERAFPPQPHYLGSTTCDLQLNIVIQAVGSRGDVQPFIALGTSFSFVVTVSDWLRMVYLRTLWANQA